ncbi:recombinase family protein [Sinorhizobium meliloti]
MDASGARDDRPGLKACLRDLRSGDVLVVWKLDRLGCSLSHLIRIVYEMKERGVAFRSPTEQMDANSTSCVTVFIMTNTLVRLCPLLNRQAGSRRTAKRPSLSVSVR